VLAAIAGDIELAKAKTITMTAAKVTVWGKAGPPMS